jgi:hypothetical protein
MVKVGQGAIERLGRWLFEPITSRRDRRLWFWGGLCWAVAIGYGLVALRQALDGEFVIQDDARQHVFWMQRFRDSAAFPNDPIADYFQSVAPVGYKALYQFAAQLGFDPLLVNKVVPLVLSGVAAVCGYGLALALWPVPLAAGLSGLLVVQALWLRDDLVSGTPAAFAGPLLLLGLWAIARHWLWVTVVAIGLLASFYPQVALVLGGALGLRLLQAGRSQGWRWRPWLAEPAAGVALAGLLALGVAIGPYLVRDSPFGPVLSAQGARSMPTLMDKGWSAFFTRDPWNYWACGQRSGFLPTEWCRIMAYHSVLVLPLGVWFGWALPLLWWRRDRWPLIQQIQPASRLLGELLLSSAIGFGAAHLLLFKLHLPNRYGEHSLRLVAALAAGMVLATLLERAWAGLQRGGQRAIASGAAAGLLSLWVVAYPIGLAAQKYEFPITNYVVGNAPSLYRFLRQQPIDTVVASLAREGDNLPAFSGRSIYVGGQGYLLPYHLGFYQDMVRRLDQLLTAQYASNWPTIQSFLYQSGVDFWLVERSAFGRDFVDSRRFRQFGLGAAQIAQLDRGEQPILPTAINACAVWQQGDLALLEAKCLKAGRGF